jgi:hypothetical protein
VAIDMPLAVTSPTYPPTPSRPQEKELVSPAQILELWDDNGDGEVSMGEFRLHVRKLGLSASQKDLDALFAQARLRLGKRSGRAGNGMRGRGCQHAR